ncbi:MAG TPA: hypothetical protein VMU92_00120 [Acidobacteriaceae bacterium]|nr:hypothetical protein [Acidobacteriaceae bacterium]
MKGLISRLTITVVAAAAMIAVPAANAYHAPRQDGYSGGQRQYQGQYWSGGIPQRLQQVMQEGFAGGVRGAHKDAGNHRSWNVNNRDEYRHPHYRGLQREAYRCSFRLGYRFAVERMTGRQWGRDDDH